jgi:diketogulonate reductase-like aldo/keto reductase
MKHISLGGLDVSRIGLGAMTMAGTYTSGGGLDDPESIRTIHRALELGVTHIDTAEIYGPFHSEEIVGRAIKDRRDQVVERDVSLVGSMSPKNRPTWPAARSRWIGGGRGSMRPDGHA